MTILLPAQLKSRPRPAATALAMSAPRERALRALACEAAGATTAPRGARSERMPRARRFSMERGATTAALADGIPTETSRSPTGASAAARFANAVTSTAATAGGATNPILAGAGAGGGARRGRRRDRGRLGRDAEGLVTRREKRAQGDAVALGEGADLRDEGAQIVLVTALADRADVVPRFVYARWTAEVVIAHGLFLSLLARRLEADLGVPNDATGVSDIGRSAEGVLLGEV